MLTGKNIFNIYTSTLNAKNTQVEAINRGSIDFSEFLKQNNTHS